MGDETSKTVMSHQGCWPTRCGWWVACGLALYCLFMHSTFFYERERLWGRYRLYWEEEARTTVQRYLDASLEERLGQVLHRETLTLATLTHALGEYLQMIDRLLQSEDQFSLCNVVQSMWQLTTMLEDTQKQLQQTQLTLQQPLRGKRTP